jgi:type I restriction enzyme, S subunit
MSKQYICDLCKKVFNQKIDFTRHQNKKAPCISLTEMQQIIQTTEEKVDSKNLLTQTFKSCLNVMRDNEGLTGEKALRNLSYLLVLKLIEHHIGKEINFENYEYDFSHIDEDLVEKHKNKLLGIIRFSNLSKEKEDNIPVNIKYLWDDILSKHPITKNIFLKEKGFDIQHKSTFKKLIEKLHLLDLSKTEYDVLGNAYEEVIKDVMTGKVLGQFFTQPLVKKIMVRLINPQIFPDGKIESCCDPTMGTGGFLITYLQYILQQARTKNIIPDWDFIKNEGIYGKELEPATYQLAISNMLISSGHMFEKLDRGDSIRDPITRKFDNILANPPFGIKGLKYDDFESSLKNQYIPIKTDNAVSLFIQAIIYMLKNNGKCAVVLPDGQDLFSKTNTTLVSIREYLMKTCDLKEIIYLPAGIFENTSIKTCIFYFVKKMEGSEILETKIKLSKTQKENGRDYIFSKTHQTTKVRFYDYNETKDEKFLLVEVPIEKLVSNSYSLNYAEYMKDEAEEEQYEEGIVVKTLGEVCKFKNGTNITKEKLSEGDYPVIGGGQKPLGFHNEYNVDENTILISKDGAYAGYISKYNKKVFVSNHGIYITNIENNIIKDYIYYYLKLVLQDKLYSLQTGTAQPGINKEHISKLKIPIPSLERQEEIVKYLDFIYEKANKTSNEKISELKRLNEFCLNNQKIFGENEIKKLGELCEFIKTGKNKPSDNKTGTLYPYYGTGSITGYTDEYLYDGYYILTARNGTIGNCFLTEGRFFPSDHIFVIDIKDKCLMKYVYYILSNNEKLDKLKTGVGIPNITKGTLENLIIQVPSLERQKEIVDYCEFNDTLIKQLEKEIENNNFFAQEFIRGVVKSQVHNIEEEYTENIESTEYINKTNDETDSIDEDVIEEPKPIIKKILIKIKKN